MKADLLVSIDQANCRHETHRKYTERSFDILNNFELTAVRCCSCYKTLELKIKKLC